MEQQKATIKRSPNLVCSEKDLLTSLVRKHWEVLENKKTNAVTTNKKKQCWHKLADEFNAQSSVSYRTAATLKGCYENLKKRLKKDSANARRAAFSTGGGPSFEPTEDPFAARIKDLIKPNVNGFYNPNVNGFYNPNDNDSVMGKPDTENEELLLTTPDHLGNIDIEYVEVNDTIQVSLDEPDNEHKEEMTEPEREKRKENPKLIPGKGKKANLSRRRPIISLSKADQLSETKCASLLELRAQTAMEHEKKILILDEELKQAKIKTRLLELELALKENKN